MLKKFPISGNIHHAAVQPDATLVKVVSKGGESDKDVNLVGRSYKDARLVRTIKT